MLVIIFLGLMFFAGCAQSSLPCLPSSYYAPPPGAPYTADEVEVLTRDGYQLAGTMTVPSGSKGPFPAVVLISGSHPSDRDCVSSRDEIVKNYRPFLQIADVLSSRGLAVLRLDDRGVGCSIGGDIHDATLLDRADDIRAGIDFLRTRNEIDQARIGLLGISEGGSIGPLIASSDNSIRALVIMAGTARNGWKILEYQCRYEVDRNRGLTADERDRICADNMDYWKTVEKEEQRGRHFNYSLNYDPLNAARRVKCPVLIIHGNRDAAVPVQDALVLNKVIRDGGNEDVTLEILKNHNHLFIEDSDGRVSRYGRLLKRRHKISDKALTIIADWLTNRLGP